jgi:DNA-nicking Smr family endonuclease
VQQVDVRKLLAETQSPPSLTKIVSRRYTGVHEIRNSGDYLSQRKTLTAGRCKQTSADTDAVRALEDIVNGRRPVNLSDTQEYVEWINKDYCESIINRLHRGQYAVQDCLDLHGIVVDDGRKEVETFFRESMSKGTDALKLSTAGVALCKWPGDEKSLITWLLRRYRKNIIAFVTRVQ